MDGWLKMEIYQIVVSASEEEGGQSDVFYNNPKWGYDVCVTFSLQISIGS